MSPFWILLELRVMEVVVTTGATRRARLQSKNVTTNNQYPGYFVECGDVKYFSYSLKFSLSLHFNGHFPGGPGLAGTRKYPFWILLELRMMEVVVTTGAIRRANLQSNVTTNKPTPSFLQAVCPSCRPTSSVKALRGIKALEV